MTKLLPRLIHFRDAPIREAATKFLLENQHKRSIRCDAEVLKMLDSYIGDLTLESVHMGTLQPYITARRQEGVKSRTILWFADNTPYPQSFGC